MKRIKTNYKFGLEERNEIIKKEKNVIEFALLQTSQQHRDDLRQHLYEIVIKTLENVKFKEPKGLFEKNNERIKTY
ncbi:hypothetical protein ABFY48_26080 [Lysinibacillus pakistanensis]|uniref:hypothetical protein n=1 Tax=Lysinibacillus pakistanensis TaxID=759811 RepID=UPI003D2B3757